MTNGLNWTSNTNTTENSCQNATCDCLTMWEIYQQEVMKRLSNVQNQKNNGYKLEPGYEARARRIAATYAKIYLEQEINGNDSLIGRYYWMGLGAFASKTVAAIFKHWSSIFGYNVGVTEAINLFASGNLWLCMDIAPWHFMWSASPATFTQCKSARNLNNFTHIKTSVMNLPWSSSLSKVKYLQLTPEVDNAFKLLPSIENIFKASSARQIAFKENKDNLLKHLMFIAVQEQRNILQVLVWESSSVQSAAWMQRQWWILGTPDATLVLSSDYDVDAVKKNLWGNYQGRHANTLGKMPEDVYIEPLDDTVAENYDSRMIWITKAAEKYHRLMIDAVGRPFLEQELGIIAGWQSSKANFRIHPSSNQGKN